MAMGDCWYYGHIWMNLHTGECCTDYKVIRKWEDKMFIGYICTTSGEVVILDKNYNDAMDWVEEYKRRESLRKKIANGYADAGVFINLYTGEVSDSLEEAQSWRRYITVGVVVNGEWVMNDEDVHKAYLKAAELNKEEE